MKKTFLSIITTLSALSMAGNVIHKTPAQTQFSPIDTYKATGYDLNASEAAKAASPADDSTIALDFHYCGEAQTALRAGNGEDVENSAAIKLPQEWLARYAGCKITEVKILSGFNGQTKENYITDATVFISNDIFEGEPVYTQRAKLSKKGMTWNDIALKTPYVISGDKDIYVGYTVVRPGEYDAPFCVDRSPNMQKCSFWVNYELDGDRRWEDWSDLYGSVCMHLTIEGDSMPLNDMTVSSLALPNMAGLNSNFTFSYTVTNHGVNPVYSFTVEYTLGSNKSQPMVIEIPDGLAYDESGVVEASGIASQDGTEVPFQVEVTKVNGKEDSYPTDNVVSGNLFIIDPTLGFKRTMLFEEGTGTWCGWCPRGTAVISYMNEKHEDGSFIGIAYHQGDPMQVSMSEIDYEHGFGNHFVACPSYPNARYNRIKSYTTDIKMERIDDIYNDINQLPAIADIDFSLYFTDESKQELAVAGTTEFAIDSDTEYRVAYILVEDGLGPFAQQNYYSGSSTPRGGWENLESSAKVMFDHVGRYITAFNGEEGTVPAKVERGGVYGHSATIPLDRLMKKNVNNASVVGAVINQKTGEVENAKIVHCSDELPIMEENGVAVNPAVDGQAEWFNLQGVRMAAPTAPGVYVKVAGGKSEKVIVK